MFNTSSFIYKLLQISAFSLRSCWCYSIGKKIISLLNIFRRWWKHEIQSACIAVDEYGRVSGFAYQPLLQLQFSIVSSWYSRTVFSFFHNRSCILFISLHVCKSKESFANLHIVHIHKSDKNWELADHQRYHWYWLVDRSFTDFWTSSHVHLYQVIHQIEADPPAYENHIP